MLERVCVIMRRAGGQRAMRAPRRERGECACAPGHFGGGEWVIEYEDANQERDSKSIYGEKLYRENTFYREHIL